MIVVAAGKIVASIAAGAVTLASVRNMAETAYISSSTYAYVPTASSSAPPTSILSTYLATDENGKLFVSIPDGKNTDDIIDDLKGMKRKDLLTLFLNCEAPSSLSLSDTKLDFDGILLNNNSVLTSVSGFITNRLFGINHRGWNGKTLNHDGQAGVGINRFYRKEKEHQHQNEIATEHRFDHSISPSKLGKQGDSLVLRYANHQNQFSPWKTMEDELRVLKKGSKDDDDDDDRIILLGMGSMAWSGAHWNCQPFGLVQSKS